MTELEQLSLKYQITISSVSGAADPRPPEWEGRDCRAWTVTLSWHGPHASVEEPITLTTSFFQGFAHNHDPTAADVLSSLLVDAAVEDYRTFEDWCADLGYNTDSRQAYTTWRGCMAMAPRVRAFLGEVFEELRDAEH